MPKAPNKKPNHGDKNNQKSILQFFKAANIPQNGVSAKLSETQEHKSSTKPSKRRSISPINFTNKFNVMTDKSNKTPEKCKLMSESSAKKSKIDSNKSFHEIEESCRLKSPLKNIMKVSPNKNYGDTLNKLTNNIKENISHEDKNLKSLVNIVRSPKRSPQCKAHVSPNGAKVITPSKMHASSYLSPSKSGSTVKALTFNDNDIEDIFDDEWDMETVQDIIEDLDLNIIQRCEIISTQNHSHKLELKLKNDQNQRGTCFVEGIWLNTPLQPGEIISIIASRNSSGHFSVNNTSGLLALRPDHLISTTSVVAGVFCKRKAVLQERWKGIDSANTAMTLGILIHELVQKALTQSISNISVLNSEADKMVKESIQMLYDAGMKEEEARSNMQIYIGPLAEFMQTYVAKSTKSNHNEKGKWNAKIEKVLDIEENVCCPQLGLKGKIDATLQVTIHERGGSKSAIMPLELKSGRASGSAEHRGQLVLYGMMLSAQARRDPATDPQRGALLYLKDKVDVREVSCGYPERRDLMMLRNELVRHLAAGPQEVDPEQIADIEDASKLLQQSLPEPVRHQSACGKCPYLTVCSIHLWHTDEDKVSESHPLHKLRDEALGHLSPEHIKYFLHWSSLLKLEEKGQITASPLHALWTESVDKRAKRGVCAANLILQSVTKSGDRFLHKFSRQFTHADKIGKNVKGPNEGEFSIVSIDNRPWIAAGVVTHTGDNELQILLERDLSRRLDKNTLFHIDTYESYATTVQNLTNLGVLMEDSDRALRLRQLIIDKEAPDFASKLPGSVGRLGVRLLRALNVQQQRAVLSCVAARRHTLLRGLPGTGKTQTISVLIQMLVALKQRVLVTAHTHSAVDTVLTRLPESLRIMRLGSASRVAPRLSARCEQKLIADCHTAEQLEQLYNSMEVVGVTCLGAAHALLARNTFDVCVVDEATQVLQCTVLRPLFAAKRFVLVGDPEQLPPVVKSRTARRLGMEESLFHRLMSEEATRTLQLQYRMNQPLADVANRVAYSDALRCADQTVAQARMNINMQKLSQKSLQSPWLVAACSSEPEDAAIFLDMDLAPADKTDEKVFTNREEGCLVMAIIEALKEGGVPSSDIGVIAPYRDQVTLLKRSLAHLSIEVSTVDQFQGRDKCVIIYSCTKRDDDGRKVKDGEILNDRRRLAVSVTRAKHKLIVVGNLRVLRRYTSILRLVEACKTLTLKQDTVAQINNKYGNLVT